MSDRHEQPEEKETHASGLQREASAEAVRSLLKNQRLVEEMLNPSTLRLFSEQQEWLKTISGAAAMPTEITKLFSTPNFASVAGSLVDYERTRRALAGFNPALDLSRQLRVLTAVGTFPAFHEATLASQRISQLIRPLDLSPITRDLTGVSDAVASVAGMIRPPALGFAGDIGAIASSALGSWRTYVDSLPSALNAPDLFQVQAAARGTLGITASSAILLGGDEAVETAEEWELAPAEMRERMRDGLRRISPHLVARLDGAWDAVTHAGPDSVSQAANSAIEVIDWTLRLGCDDAGLESWVAGQSKPSVYRDNSGRPTREAKIRYLLRGSDFEAEFVAATARNLDALRRELQKLKHTNGEHDVDAVARLLPSVEALLFLIVD
jgi:hypothetical protein